MNASLHSSRSLAFCALLAIVLLAWFPSLYPRTLVADDFHYRHIPDHGLIEGSLGHLKAMGIWRWWGSTILGAMLGGHPLVYPVGALLTHFLAILVFYESARRVAGSGAGALGAALLVSAMPVGYQALLWASAYHYLLATLLFWLLLLCLADYGDVAGRQRLVFLSSFLLTIACALVHEALILCAVLCPIFLWWPARGEKWRPALRRLRERYGGTGPAAGALVYVVLYLTTLTDLTTKKPGTFNLFTIASVYYHQLFQAELLTGWLSPMVRASAFSNWSGGTVVAASLLALGAMLAVRRAASAAAGASGRGLPSRRAIVLLASLLLGASLVYAVHGGFSRDSRKQYPIVYFSVLALSYGWTHWIPPGWKRPLFVKSALGAALAVEVGTTWLLIGLWQSEAKRSDQLVQLIIDRGITGEVRIESHPDIYQSWSFMEESFGFRHTDESILNQAFARQPPLPGQLRVTTATAAPLLSYNASRGIWEFRGGKPRGP